MTNDGATRIVQRKRCLHRVWLGLRVFDFCSDNYFARHGTGLGAMVDAGGARLTGGVRSPRFLGRVAGAAAMQAQGSIELSVLGKMTWHRNYERFLDAMRVGDLVAG